MLKTFRDGKLFVNIQRITSVEVLSDKVVIIRLGENESHQVQPSNDETGKAFALRLCQEINADLLALAKAGSPNNTGLRLTEIVESRND